MNLDDLIRAAIDEDLPRGDVTTDALALGERHGRAKLVAKQDLVLSGQIPFERTMRMLSPQIETIWEFHDGDIVLAGQNLALLKGDLVWILKGERTALNFLGPLSGIATLTARFVQAVKGTETKILDTRKTRPAYRFLEKSAVLHGGGFNHRHHLSAAALIKENHIRAAGGITAAIRLLREKGVSPIEVETTNQDEVKEAVKSRVDRILLDNMSNEEMKSALNLIPDSIETEASGNMTLDRVRSVALLGVDYISIGALTHSAPCADISLLFDWTTHPAL